MSSPAEPRRRMCQLWFPNWSITARRRAHPELRDFGVVVIGRVDGREVVVSASGDAHAAGVAVGQRRRDAEAVGAELVLIDHDPSLDARELEVVARAVEAITPQLEIMEPGRLAFPMRGPARYHGGDQRLVATVIAAIQRVGVYGVRVGVADGAFAAGVATQRAQPDDAWIVEAAASAAFLAPWPITTLDPAIGDGGALTDLLYRLGLSTLGAFAALDPPRVLARFGAAGQYAHQLAHGIDAAPGPRSSVPEDGAEQHEFDPPVDRVDTAAFAAKSLADALLDRLATRGLACTRVQVEAITTDGEVLTRVWRASEPFTPGALAERVRWQLDAWLTAGNGRPPDSDLTDAGVVMGGLTQLRLAPDEVVIAHGRQLGFWGGDAAADERAARVLARVQGMLNPDAVVTPVLQGGRIPDERVRWVRMGDPREATPLRALVRRAPDRARAPWPGAVPGPGPARVVNDVAAFTTYDGTRVVVDGRGEANGVPARLVCDALPGGHGVVRAWNGPWPYDTRWWDARTHRRGAVWHVVVECDRFDGGDAGDVGEVACLVAVSRGRARVIAVHD